jgi:ABC-type multidrug transport system fused ATPase/permease subunit
LLFLPIDRVFRIIDSGNQKPQQQPSTITTTEQRKVSFPSSTSKTASSTTSTTSLSFTKTVDAIFIENLSFSYKLRSSSSLILHSLNLTISKSQITCIIGKSGSGKSTLASLLCGLYQPTSGKIIYGSNNVKEMIIIQGNTEEEREREGEGEQVEQKKAEKKETQRLHNMFGVVQQASSTLFSGTIADNIAYGKVITVSWFICLFLFVYRFYLMPLFTSSMQHKKMLNMLQD